MAVHIRLTRVGATRHPAYRVIAIDSRRSRDGRALEILGFYDPLSDPITVKLDDERIANWVARGARPSAAVQRLMKVAAAGPRPKPKRAPAPEEEAAGKPRRAARTKKATAEPAAEPVAETAVETPTQTEAVAPAEAAAETAPEADAGLTSEATDEPAARAPDETAAETAGGSETTES